MVIDELPNTKPIFSLPFVLLARDKRSSKEISAQPPSGQTSPKHSPNSNSSSANTSPTSSPPLPPVSYTAPLPVVATTGEPYPPKRMSTDIDMMMELEAMLLRGIVPPALQSLPAQPQQSQALETPTTQQDGEDIAEVQPDAQQTSWNTSTVVFVFTL